ncbi:MAG: hypothetical protein ACTSO7_12605 [Candidatus Heimdallarchaeota archaeon]
MKADSLIQSSKADIVTIGCENQLQRRNTLKGLALQKLVRYTMKTSEEDISVKRIFEQLLNKQSEYYVIGIPFKTQEKGYYRKWRFVHHDDLPVIVAKGLKLKNNTLENAGSVKKGGSIFKQLPKILGF